MKYVLLFGETREFSNALDSAQHDALMAPVMKWFEKYGSRLRGGHQLQPDRTATTIRFNNGKPVVVDGPFIEGKETIGGYAEVEVDDLDQALAMAKDWPTGGPVEVRPIIEQEGM